MPKEFVTISRQYGSGGREVGEHVAELLGYTYYDKALLNRMAQIGDVDVDFVSVGGEGLMGKVSSLFLHPGSEGRDEDSLPLPDRLFLAQSRTIKEIVKEGPCVIIGHSADYFLQESEKALNVFIYADWEARIRRVMRRNNLDEHEAVLRIKKMDRNRSSFYEQYTGRKWGKPENYHMCCSSSFFGIEELAELIAHIARTT